MSASILFEGLIPGRFTEGVQEVNQMEFLLLLRLASFTRGAMCADSISKFVVA